MSNQSLLVEKRDKVALIILNRPEVHNAINTEIRNGFIKAISSLSADDSINVVVVKANGKNFSAGADLKELKDKSISGTREYNQSLADMCLSIRNCVKPVIFSVHGYVMGGACGLVALADMAIASDNTILALPEIDLGIFPTLLLMPMLYLLSKRDAFEMLFLAKRLNAEAALKKGLINEVCPADKLEARTMELATNLAQKNAFAVQLGKDLWNRTMRMDLEVGLRSCCDVAWAVSSGE